VPASNCRSSRSKRVFRKPGYDASLRIIRPIIATHMKPALLCTVRSKSFASRLCRLSHPRVRSTIHRQCSTSNPVASSRRRTMSSSQPNFDRTHSTSVPAYPASAHTFSTRGDSFEAASSNGLAPSRSCVLAGCTSTPISMPSTSTRMCRFRPATFFPSVVTAGTSLLRRLDRLAVHDKRTRLRVPTLGNAHGSSKCVVHVLPDSVLAPLGEVAVDRSPVGEVVWKTTPSASVSGDVEHSIDDLTSRILRRTAARLRLRNDQIEQLPLLVGNVRRIGLSLHSQSNGHLQRFLNTL
jgi:hypothetical protein